jgi:hypothetical protein
MVLRFNIGTKPPSSGTKMTPNVGANSSRCMSFYTAISGKEKSSIVYLLISTGRTTPLYLKKAALRFINPGA